MDNRDLIERVADTVIDWVGSLTSLFLHTCFFLFWYDMRLDIVTLLTVVSLEAIYLAILIQIGINRHGKRDTKQAREDHIKLDQIIAQLKKPAARRNGKKTVR